MGPAEWCPGGLLGSPFYVDCMAVQLGSKNGASWAEAPARKLARAWIPLANILQDTSSVVNWMPAHMSAKDVGIAVVSSGQHLLEIDLQTTGLVDALAKDEANKRQPAKPDKRLIVNTSNLVLCLARWIGQCTVLANNFPIPKQDGGVSNVRDSSALRFKRTAFSSSPRVARKRPKAGPTVFVSITSVPQFKRQKVGSSRTPSGSQLQESSIEAPCFLPPPVPKRRRISERQSQLRNDALFCNYWLGEKAGKTLNQPEVSGKEKFEALRKRIASKGVIS